MLFLAKEVADILQINYSISAPDRAISKIRTDSRSLPIGDDELFVAIIGKNHDGHQFVEDLEEKGLNNFLISQAPKNPKQNTNYFIVEDTLKALQLLAEKYHEKFDLLTIGITGSNGKTVCKVWLKQILQNHFKTLASPKSYNSQVGVPLSLLQVNDQTEIGIFEAGISKKNEMHKHAQMMKAQVGIFTHLGDAHAKNFNSLSEKLMEKLKLFEHAETIIFPSDNDLVYARICELYPTKELISWGKKKHSDYKYRAQLEKGKCHIEINKGHSSLHFFIAFTDEASIKNAVSCIVCSLKLGLSRAQIQHGLENLQIVELRMEKRRGINNCEIILDAYNADINSLQIALDELAKHNKSKKKSLILSTFDENKENPLELIAKWHRINSLYKLLLVGKHEVPKSIQTISESFNTSSELLKKIPEITFEKEIVLIKGSRRFKLEKVAASLAEKSNQTLFEVNLNALENNLNIFRSKLAPKTKIMIMVKAFAYGNGGSEIGQFLSQKNIDYLAVAYVDEGVALRKSGVETPIMVLSTQPNQIEEAINYKLEPVIYSLRFLQQIKNQKTFMKKNIHIELNTGMNRLGINKEEIPSVIQELINSKLSVKSVFSHLVQSEIPKDTFGEIQISEFQQMCEALQTGLKKSFVKHICNSMGIINYPNAHFDMVRLGLGLYGLSREKALENVGVVKSYISQIRTVKKGESIGYGRKNKTKTDRKIAVIPIGYADGYSRKFSQGKGFFIIQNKHAPVVGNVCMDMTMCDVSEIDCKEGERIFVYKSAKHFYELSKNIDTIPYELISTISQRVPRKFTYE